MQIMGFLCSVSILYWKWHQLIFIFAATHLDFQFNTVNRYCLWFEKSCTDKDNNPMQNLFFHSRSISRNHDVVFSATTVIFYPFCQRTAVAYWSRGQCWTMNHVAQTIYLVRDAPSRVGPVVLSLSSFGFTVVLEDASICSYEKWLELLLDANKNVWWTLKQVVSFISSLLLSPDEKNISI